MRRSPWPEDGLAFKVWFVIAALLGLAVAGVFVWAAIKVVLFVTG